LGPKGDCTSLKIDRGSQPNSQAKRDVTNILKEGEEEEFDGSELDRR
jgi:hypothetical protein